VATAPDLPPAPKPEQPAESREEKRAASKAQWELASYGHELGLIPVVVPGKPIKGPGQGRLEPIRPESRRWWYYAFTTVDQVEDRALVFERIYEPSGIVEVVCPGLGVREIGPADVHHRFFDRVEKALQLLTGRTYDHAYTAVAPQEPVGEDALILDARPSVTPGVPPGWSPREEGSLIITEDGAGA
jgi:hypothetical protein